MTGRNTDHSDALKWYPRAWRDHYGHELTAFLHDRYGDRSIPVAARLSIVRSGTLERLRSGGFIGTSVDPDRRVRGASLLVLCAWGVFVVAGAAFAKYTEHWPMATPRNYQALPGTAMSVVRVAASAGVLILVVAGLVTLPAFVTLVRSVGWRAMWATTRALAFTAALAGVASVVVIAWSQHLAPSQTSSAPLALKAFGAAWGLMLVASLAVGAGTIVAIVDRLRLSHGVTRALGVLAVAMAGVLALIFAGTLTWWITTAMHAPWFFGSLVPRAQGPPAPLAMLVFCVMMLSGLALAGFGTVRIVTGLSLPDDQHGMAGRPE